MALRQPIFGRAMYADAAIAEGQLVKISSNESVSPAVAGTDNVVGMALKPAEAGELFPVELFAKGIVELTADGSVSAGQNVTSGANGVAAAATGDVVFGVALTSGLDANIVVMVK